MTKASSTIEVARFVVKNSQPFSLVLCKGSVANFQHNRGAIVNAANEECLGGGGVDGAIASAGGKKLLRDRLALPAVKNEYSTSNLIQIRCPTGEAKVTGPGSYGSLGVPYVIHAVGPNYMNYDNHEQADELLKLAYVNSLKRAKEAKLEAIAFSLLSSGVFRGTRSVNDVLHLGVKTICEFEGYDELKEVQVFGFTSNEMNTLLKITSNIDLLEKA